MNKPPEPTQEPKKAPETETDWVGMNPDAVNTQEAQDFKKMLEEGNEDKEKPILQ